VLNDILDVESDRQHPSKKNRPLASGAVSLKVGWILSLCLMSVAFFVSGFFLGKVALLCIVAYALLNVIYSFWWKHIPVLDVFTISMGFMLRILMGTLGLSIKPSSWLLFCGFMLTLFLGFTKRREELLSLERAEIKDRALTRKVLDAYNPFMVEQFMAISAACAILTYGLYTVSAETIARHGTENLIYTLPFVVYGIFRYIFILHIKQGGRDTARDMFSDKHLAVTIFAWICVTMAILA
jgi:4-hydroxybenzoate polyprenyltransferase